MSEYIVVYRFCTSRPTTTEVNKLKKFAPHAKFEGLEHGTTAIVLGHCYSMQEANQLIHDAVANGYWGGIYQGD